MIELKLFLLTPVVVVLTVYYSVKLGRYAYLRATYVFQQTIKEQSR